MVQIRVFYKTVVDKEKLFSSGSFSKGWSTNKTVNFNHSSFFLNGHELFICFTTKNIDNPLPKVRGWQFKELRIIVEKVKMDIWVRECNAMKFIHNMTQFHGIRF